MKLSRRDFLKVGGASLGGLAVLNTIGIAPSLAAPYRPIPLKKTRLGEKTTICCYCAVGCGAIASAEGGKVVNIEGDPDHPINQGALCSKGEALSQFRTVDGKDNPNRLTKPLYRRSGGMEWEEITWDRAVDEIARKIKKTRDDNWLETVNVGGTAYPVNRTDAIANFGGGELDNEECYLLVKMARALGLVYVEHCARI